MKLFKIKKKHFNIIFLLKFIFELNKNATYSLLLKSLILRENKIIFIKNINIYIHMYNNLWCI